MSPQLAALLCTLGLALGGAAGLRARPAAPEPALFAPATRPGPHDDPCVEMADALGRDLADVRSDLAGLALTLPMAEARARQHGALPTAWPEDVAPAHREAGLRAALAGLDASELVALDCAEFPCLVAIVDTDPLDAAGTPGPEASPSHAVLEGLGCGPAWTTQRTEDADGTPHLVTLTSCGPTDAGDARARTLTRLRQLGAALRDPR